LSRTLKQAELKSIAGLNQETAQKMLTAREIDAYATNRQRLAEMVARIPGLRILPDNFFAVEQSIIIAKGNSAGIGYIDQFINDARNSGLLKSVLEKAKLSGVEVAPPNSR
jgi:ABC-type amino acid transport substrate-binding protein